MFVVRGYPIDRCSGCGLLFVRDPPPPEVLSELYREPFFAQGEKFATAGGPSLGARRNAERRLRALGLRPGRLLDVGCATGDFLLVAQRQGWVVAGVEWSPYAAAIARERGLDVRTGSFLETDFGLRRFDVITLWDYLEHVPDPLSHLEHARSLLEADGRLVLSTGDAASLVARVTGRRWHLMIPPVHLYFFDRRTVRLLLERAGFAVDDIRWPGKFVNLGFLGAKGAAVYPGWLTRTFARLVRSCGLHRLDLYLNLGDIMTVYARKVSG